jgi:hypothetical protein
VEVAVCIGHEETERWKRPTYCMLCETLHCALAMNDRSLTKAMQGLRERFNVCWCSLNVCWCSPVRVAKPVCARCSSGKLRDRPSLQRRQRPQSGSSALMNRTCPGGKIKFIYLRLSRSKTNLGSDLHPFGLPAEWSSTLQPTRVGATKSTKIAVVE